MENGKDICRIYGKPFVIWGAGRRTASTLKINPDIRPCYIIDSDLSKTGDISGITIIHPDELHDWKEFYFIINMKNHIDEVKKILISYGLVEKKDFCHMDEFVFSNPSVADIQKILITICFSSQNEAELKCRVNNKQEYTVLKSVSGFLKYEGYLGMYYGSRLFRVGTYRGYCAFCKKMQPMKVSYEHSNRKTPYWRETLICPSCKMNSRMRFILEYLSAYADRKIYVQEQITQFYENLKKIAPDLSGSEFLDPNFKSGDIVDGVLHEDATELSFNDNMFDIIGSFDVFEHLDNYMQGLKEARRCLKPGGIFLLSVPLFKSRYDHIRRAFFSQDGALNYLSEPQYHGNPLSEQGSLVFHEFGWKMIDDMKEAGFREVHAIVYASAEKGYLGELPVIFEALK